jgi:hypothetical protein
MEIKRTVKTDMTIKTARIEDNILIDENGEEIDIVEVARQLYGEGEEFKLTLTRSTSEEVELDDIKTETENEDDEE